MFIRNFKKETGCFLAWIAVVLSFLSAGGQAMAETRLNGTSAEATGLRGYRPLNHMWYGTRDIPNKKNAIIFGAGVALTVGALAFVDSPVKNFFSDRRRMGGLGKLGDEILGTGVPGVLIGAGTFGYGMLSGRQHEVEAGEAHLEALAASFAYTSALKFTVRRERPSSANRLSFPSGHTSTTFTSAGSLMGMYGPVLGVPALALASYTGIARLAANAHHVSDVLFGATLGYIVGYSYTLHHQHHGVDEDRSIEFRPYYESKSGFGMTAEARF